MNSEGNYEHESEEGVWIDDDRFRSSHAPVTAIATSVGQRDSGLFELNFRDERYLPFEGAGAISEWQLELTTDAALRQFDYSTISDVILHLNYTAREAGGLFKEAVVNYLNRFLDNADDLDTQPLCQVFRLKHDFPSEWHKFLHPASTGADQILGVTLKPEHLPFITQGRAIDLSTITVLAKTKQPGDYHLIVTAMDKSEQQIPSSQITMPQLPDHPIYGNLHVATLTGNAANLNVEDIDVFAPFTFRLKHSSAPDFASLATNPDEVADMWLVFHYALGG